MRYALILPAFLAACANGDNWRATAMECVETMETVGPAVISCANHMKQDHPGHTLDSDGSMRIRTR